MQEMKQKSFFAPGDEAHCLKKNYKKKEEVKEALLCKTEVISSC